jgi:molecular chaperone GrpE
MMTLNRCFKGVLLIAITITLCCFFCCDDCDAFVAKRQQQPSTRRASLSSSANNWWENTNGSGHLNGGIGQQQQQQQTFGMDQQQQQPFTVESRPKSYSAKTTSAREQELERQVQHLQAKLDNMKGRGNRDNTQALVTLLEVSDNLSRALEAVPEQEKKRNEALQALCNGLQLTESTLDQVFQMSGIVPYGTIGDVFDHNYHHAVCEFPGDPQQQQTPDTLGHIIQSGYLWNGTVLRYAQVAVVKAEGSMSQDSETCDF